ncbi:serine dehydratase beta chain-domain-containing protein [Helicostylum pulchrum]|uniref:Serine dehydratase beta chain domain-containing protein n=1 Tax=Helicostylum pulchrum TaxID=562976 RepID=A0ABP9Y3F4_9FUNG|nr:serine dehydratase beta chain-domain-containing protein [Helicostylum pulchrum]
MVKHIPKLLSRHNLGSTTCIRYQKLFLSTVATATTEEYNDIDHHNIVSTFNLFSIGIGPSSSRTVGPMSASKIFIQDLKQHNMLSKVYTLRVDMFGSLALTGKGHGTPESILMGIEGESAESVKTSTIQSRVQQIYTTHSIQLDGTHHIHFNPDRHLIFNYFKTLPQHLNGIRFCAFDSDANMIATNKYFIGGGFIVNEPTQLNYENTYHHAKKPICIDNQLGITVRLPFKSAQDLLQTCKRKNVGITQLVHENNVGQPKYSDKKCF